MIMDGKAANRHFGRRRTDIWIAVGYRVWWWAVGLMVLGALSGPGCGTNLSPTVVESECAPVLNTAGADTGLDTCSDGTLRRRAALGCPLPPVTSSSPVCNQSDCTSDADCTLDTSAYFPKVYCAEAHHIGGLCGCFTACLEDADCAPGSICVCEGLGDGRGAGECLPATCTTNGNCGGGFACVGTTKGTAGGACNWISDPWDPPIEEFVCQRADDSCRGQADCADAGSATLPDGAATTDPACVFDGTRRACGLFCAGPV